MVLRGIASGFAVPFCGAIVLLVLVFGEEGFVGGWRVLGACGGGDDTWGVGVCGDEGGTDIKILE